MSIRKDVNKDEPIVRVIGLPPTEALARKEALAKRVTEILNGNAGKRD